MAKKNILKDICSGIQKTIVPFLIIKPVKKKIIEIEITPDVKIFTNNYLTPDGMVSEKIIKIINRKDKGFIYPVNPLKS